MKWYRVLFEALLLLCAVFLQVGVLARWNLPGATPDLVLVLVTALAMQRGPLVGAISGFSAGLLLDLVSPSTGTLGLTALLLIVVGVMAGRAGGDDHAIVRPLVVVSVAATFMVFGYALLSGLLDRRSLIWDNLPLIWGTEVLYCLILATFVFPTLSWFERKLANVGTNRFRDI